MDGFRLDALYYERTEDPILLPENTASLPTKLDLEVLDNTKIMVILPLPGRQ